MNTMITVLESKTATSKKGNSYTIVLARIGGVVGRIFSEVSLSEHIDREIKVTLAFPTNREMFFSPRIVAVVE